MDYGSLESLMDGIIGNGEAGAIWKRLLETDGMAPDITGSIFYSIVRSQFDEYKKKGMDPAKEGYHIPVPWNGRLEEAHILFLGSNPGFTPNSLGPRLHVEDSPGGGIYYTWPAKGTDGARFGLGDMKKFCREVFDCPEYSPLDKRLSFSVHVKGKNKKTRLKKGGVPYWNVMCRFAEKLLPPDDRYSDEGSQDARERHMRHVMKNLACMEVVPFASKDEGALGDGLLDHCWRNFTEKILKYAPASVLALVGKKARDAFLRNMPVNGGQNAKDVLGILKRGEIYERSFGGDTKKIVAVEHFSGRRGWLQPENYFPGPGLHELRAVIAGKILH